MVMRPRAGGSHVVYCHGAELKVISNEEWEKAKSRGQPELAINREEARVLERFLRHWLRDEGEGPLYDEPDVDAVFDY